MIERLFWIAAYSFVLALAISAAASAAGVMT